MGRIQAMDSKIEKRWKQEKVATRTKQISINALEQWRIKLGADPHIEKSV
jgi:hypothetical protein